MLWIFHICLLIFTTLLFHIGVRNPNRSSTNDYVANEGTLFKFIVLLMPIFGQCLLWISTTFQVIYLFLCFSSANFVSIFISQVSLSTDALPLTPISLFGFLLMIIGGFGRIWCYQTLGTFFTYEITIRSSHKLIRTGPYAYVRHPSYTFAILLTIGMFLVHQRIGHFFPHSSWLQIQLGPIGLIGLCVMLMFFIRRRVTHEEKALDKQFGKQWTDYVSKTHGFIPHLI
jgi:protein-S-isoprenylcysteine O-methyltransferase Ste14